MRKKKTDPKLLEEANLLKTLLASGRTVIAIFSPDSNDSRISGGMEAISWLRKLRYNFADFSASRVQTTMSS